MFTTQYDKRTKVQCIAISCMTVFQELDKQINFCKSLKNYFPSTGSYCYCSSYVEQYSYLHSTKIWNVTLVERKKE